MSDITYADYEGCIKYDGGAEFRVTSPNAAGGTMTMDYCKDCWQDERDFHYEMGRGDKIRVKEL